VLPGAGNTIRQVINSALAKQELRLNVIAEVDSVHGLLTLVAQGMASSIVPLSAIDAEMRPRLHVAPLVAPKITSRLVLAIPKAGTSSRLASGCAMMIRQLDLAALAA
jgi:LysR family nitrogen assimilation transcriptional regulator